MIVKQRIIANEIDKMELVGNVKDKTCIIIDDMIDTAGTLCKATEMLKSNGANKVLHSQLTEYLAVKHTKI